LVWSEFNQKRFQDTHRIAYIVLDLNLSGIPASLQSEQVQKIARKYHNGVSRYLFGKKARRGKSQANLLIHHHPKPQHHLHMLLQIPENRNFRQVRDFTYEFILKNRERFIPQRDALCHFEETRNLIGSTIYNQKFGSDSILIFWKSVASSPTLHHVNLKLWEAPEAFWIASSTMSEWHQNNLMTSNELNTT
jgi:hypothetical protein